MFLDEINTYIGTLSKADELVLLNVNGLQSTNGLKGGGKLGETMGQVLWHSKSNCQWDGAYRTGMSRTE